MAVLLQSGYVLAIGGLLPQSCLFCGAGTTGQDLPTSATDLFNPNAISTVATTTTSSVAVSGVPVNMPSGVGSSQSLNFQPGNIVIVIGVNNTVSWINGDSVPHTVTSKSVPSGASSFNSGNMNSGAVFTYTFNIPGTYTYYCLYHNWMQGTVTVKSS
jgi:plastocyanin